MSAFDRERLQAWYRSAMRRRIAELEALRPGLTRGDSEARAAARSIGHALRGSGGSFGFPQVTGAGAALEDAEAGGFARAYEGALHVLRGVAWPEAPDEAHAWLPRVVGLDPFPSATPAEAWARSAAHLGVTEEALAARVAEALGLEGPRPLRPTPGALRLVPPYVLRERLVVPLQEDGSEIMVATSNPLDLATDEELRRLTGRTPAFVVVPPGALAAALAALGVTWGPSALGERSEAPSAAGGGETILVVDDDPGARMVARAVLERKGFEVLEAGDGLEGLARFVGRADVALAVVDLEMPGMGGRELVGRLRASPGGDALAIVILTGSDDPATEADLMEGGADDYLQKPLDPRLFMARVSATLRRARGARR